MKRPKITFILPPELKGFAEMFEMLEPKLSDLSLYKERRRFMNKQIKQILKDNFKNNFLDITVATLQLEDLFQKELNTLNKRLKKLENVIKIGKTIGSSLS